MAALERKQNSSMGKFKPLPPPSEQRNFAAFGEFVFKHSAAFDEYVMGHSAVIDKLCDSDDGSDYGSSEPT